MGLPERLVEIREKNGYTRKRLCEELGKPYATVTKYETGEREPGHNYIIDIAKKFGVTTDYILGIDTKKSPEPEGTKDKVSMDELVTMLSKAGFLDKNGDLSDADLRFLMAVGEMVRTWFADRK